MPISSGFSFYQTTFPSPRRIVRPQIVSRAAKSKATAGGPLPAQRSTAVVKQPLRSNTFTLSTKSDQTNFKVPKVDQSQNGSRQPPAKKPAIINSPSPVEQKRPTPMRKRVVTYPKVKQVTSNVHQENLQRKPVRFTNNYNDTYSSSSPAYYPKSAPLADPIPQDHLERSRPMYRTNDNYVTHRQRDSPAYAYTDYQTVSNNIPTTSYMTSLPRISQSANPTAPNVVIHPRETHYSDPPTVIIHSKENGYTRPPTVIPTLSTIPSYPSSAPFMYLPSSNAPNSMFLQNPTIPSYPPNSTMFLPNSTIPSYPHNSTMFLPHTTTATQPPVQTYLLQPPQTSMYLPQPFFYPMSLPRPNPPPPPPPPPLPAPAAPTTFVNQSSSSSVSVPTTIKTESRIEESHPTIVFQPNTNHSKKNVTIQLKMLDEDRPSQRVVRVIRDSPYRDADDVYYVEPEPPRVIYEQPRRRTEIIRRPPADDYVYVDESPSNVVRRHPHRSEVVYIDNDRPVQYDEEIVYVDDHNNEIEYIYDDEPVYPRRNYRRSSRQPSSSTNIVYR